MNGTVGGDGPGPRLFADVDRALVMSSLAAKLRAAGVPVPIQATMTATAALDRTGAMSLDDLYWVTRLSFVRHRGHIDRFDELFDAVFDTDHRSRDRRRSSPRATALGASRPGDELHSIRATVEDGAAAVDGGGLPWATLPSATDDGLDDGMADDDRAELRLFERLPSPDPTDAAKPFDLFDESELSRIGALIEASMTTWPRRRSRRRRRSPSGDRADLRRGLRQALRTGGEPFDVPRTARLDRMRRVVALLDVSGSMETFARAYLHAARPLATTGRAEVFAFATEPTRITAALRARSAVAAVELATEEVGDRFGGTRLASSLRTVIRHRSWGTLLRGSAVLVVSDGWDTDGPDELDRVMARLSRMAERVVWVNPRLAAQDFEPKVAGMAAALPHCDHFLPGHSISAMEDVLAALED